MVIILKREAAEISQIVLRSDSQSVGFSVAWANMEKKSLCRILSAFTTSNFKDFILQTKQTTTINDPLGV